MKTNHISESLTYQWVFVDALSYFNDDGHKADCYTTRKPGGEYKEVNVSSIKKARLDITIGTDKYYEDMGCSIEPNIME